MKVSQAIDSRISCRAFLAREPEPALVRSLIARSARAPSGGNLQPWHIHVVRGAKLKALSQSVLEKIRAGASGVKGTSGISSAMGEKGADYHVYPKDLAEPYRTRRFRVGEMMYDLLGIGRDDKAGRLMQFAHNYNLFGAPVGLFFSLDRQMGQPQWADVGMFMQTLMLLAREEGLHTCAQECWSAWTPSVRAALDLPDSHLFFCGLALGYMDESEKVNQLRTERADINEFAHFVGFDE